MRVALYVRVSTTEQAREGYSIEAQIEELTRYFNSNGHTIVKIYKDDGYSGKDVVSRPQLSQLIADCKTNIFDFVAVWNISRLSRSHYDSVNLVKTFSENNVYFFSLKENIDLSTPTGKFLFQLLSIIAESDRNRIIESVKLGMTQKARQGEWNGGQVLGYKSVDKQLVIEPSEAYIVRYIYELYLSGKGLKPIANQLNHNGYKTKRDKNFSINTIKTILTNPLYCGRIRFNRYENYSEKGRKNKGNNEIIVDGVHEAIITKDDWNKVQDLMKSKSSKPAKTFYGHYPLTSILRCPMCNGSMIGHRVHGRRYYQCSTHRNMGKAVCKTNLVHADNAEDFVFNKLKNIAQSPQLLKELVESSNKKIQELKKPLQEQLDYTNKAILKIKSNINKYIKLIDNTETPPASITNKLYQLEEEEKEFTERKEYLEFELQQETKSEISYDEVYHILNQFTQYIKQVSPEQQKDLLHAIINKITVHPSDDINKRSVKDIELFFDASKNPNDVLICDTVHRD